MRMSVHTYSKTGANVNNYTAKQYCFTCQTQVFDDSNNIVSSSEVKSSDVEMLVL